jgi:hypothetical protein
LNAEVARQERKRERERMIFDVPMEIRPDVVDVGDKEEYDSDEDNNDEDDNDEDNNDEDDNDEDDNDVDEDDDNDEMDEDGEEDEEDLMNSSIYSAITSISGWVDEDEDDEDVPPVVPPVVEVKPRQFVDSGVPLQTMVNE